MSLALNALLVVLATNPYLEQGRKAYESFQLDRAEQQTRLALSVPELSDVERREGVDLLALVLAARGRTAEVEQTYAEYLRDHPHAQPPVEAAPKVRASFLRAKAKVFPPRYVKLSLLPSVRERLEVSATDPWGLVKTLEWRGKEDPPVPFEATDERWVLTPRPSGAGEVVAVDAQAQSLASLKVDPMVIAAPTIPDVATAPAPSPWPRWTATLLTGALVGTGALFAALSQGDNVRAQAAPYASDARALYVSARNQALASRLCLSASIVAGGVSVWLWTRSSPP